MWRYILVWIPMVLIAILNGTLREMTYAKYLSELRAHQVSTGIGILLFAGYIGLLTRLWRIESTGQAVLIGAIWLGLTIAFEFIFGHYVVGQPWSKLLSDYNLLAGRTWLLVLLWIAGAPLLFYHFSN
jgi:hypothetical protein